jgi:hypothetical protein
MLFLLLYGFNLTVSQEQNAYQLFQSGEGIGIIYKIELDGEGFVPTNHRFTTGNQIRIHMKTNFNGYVYVINRGTSGRTVVLFPKPAMVQALTAGYEYVIPSVGWFKFVPPAGMETLTILLSNKPIQPIASSLQNPPPPPPELQQQPPGCTVITDPEVDAIIAELASRAITQGRDIIHTQEMQNDIVALFPVNSLSQTMAFDINLMHYQY